MKKTFFSLFAISMLSSCVNNRNQEKTEEVVADTISKSDTINAESDECVFDTNTYKFTKEALLKYRKDIKFKWNSKEKEAMAVFENGDTLLLHIGGCTHFSYSAVLLSSIPFQNTNMLTDKSKWLAKTFFTNGFDTKYDEFISSGKFKKNESYYPKSTEAYEVIETDTAATNMVFDGFTFEKNGKRTKIQISGYLN
jgi:hypothetical protein